ncbi:MAG: BolA family protein [Buchnera aphidicola (Eriosoma harunire)]
MLQQIKTLLSKKFHTNKIIIKNHSQKHNFHRINKIITHLQIVIISQFFLNKTLLDRHRIIQDIIKNNVTHTIYSISIHAYTKSEWNTTNKNTLYNSLCINNTHK